MAFLESLSWRAFASATFITAIPLLAAPVLGREAVAVTRIDAHTIELDRGETAPVEIWVSRDIHLDDNDWRIDDAGKSRKLRIALPATERRYVILRFADGRQIVAAERILPLEQGSNFRDIGGYVTKDGRTVRWSKAFRSGAMPLLSEADYALLGQLGIDSIVDLRSIEERQVAPGLLDDRTGALFLANDYPIKPLLEHMRATGRENIYNGMEKILAPQFRALFRRLIADEGAIIYHCSAGQDRTGVATALLYDMLGVDRETILKDYHLSTALRRPQWEMPPVDPAEYPDNPILQHYAAARIKDQYSKVESLYTSSGASHLAQFFTYLDTKYGSTEEYMKQILGFADKDFDKLRTIMLE